jgi:hypothetical protein
MPTFRRWTADEISVLINLAQKHLAAQIVAQIGRARSVISVKANEPKFSLKPKKRQGRGGSH